MKRRTAVIILVLGLLCILGAAGSIILGTVGFVDRLKPVAIVEAPGGTGFEIDTPGTYTLWHDFSNWHGGSFHQHDQRLPPGFTFTLTRLADGRSVPLKPLSGTSTMSGGQRESYGLGTFELPSPGEYRLEASNPAQDQRFLSLTQGSFLASFGSFGASFGLAALLGLVGMGALIGGFIGVLTGPKHQSATPPPPPVPS